MISNTPNDVWSSCDGQVWTKSAASDDLPACFSHTSIAADGKMWVLGGIGNDLEDVNNLAWSIDGATWIRFPQSMTQTLPFFPYSQSAAMVFDNKMWVFGIDMTSTASDMGIWYSELPPPPAFSATPALLTFAKGGPYAVDVEQGGQPTTRDLTITNINGSGVTITALDFYGPVPATSVSSRLRRYR